MIVALTDDVRSNITARANAKKRNSLLLGRRFNRFFRVIRLSFRASADVASEVMPSTSSSYAKVPAIIMLIADAFQPSSYSCKKLPETRNGSNRALHASSPCKYSRDHSE